MTITAEDLWNFAPPVPSGDTAADKAKAETALAAAEGLVSGYTRGRHRNSAGAFRPGVEQVVLMVGARILANPGQVSYREQSGSVSVSRGAGFSGFTLGERAVLDRYRKRAMG